MPVEQENNPDAKILSAHWKDCENIGMEDERHEVNLVMTEGGGKAKFESEVNYRHFKALLEQFTPKKTPFIEFGNTFIARKGTQRNFLTKIDTTLDEMTIIDFQILV